MIIVILIYVLLFLCIVSKTNRKKVCIFYTQKNYNRIIKLTLYLKDDYDITMIDNLENVKSTDVTIIPIDVKSQTILYESTVYDILDDKKHFTNM